jgi:hypothetical protein
MAFFNDYYNKNTISNINTSETISSIFEIYGMFLFTKSMPLGILSLIVKKGKLRLEWKSEAFLYNAL